MKHIARQKKYAPAFMLAGLLVAGAAMADKPAGTGGDKHARKDKHENRKGEYRGDDEKSRGHAGSTPRESPYFGDRHRAAAHEYYRERFRSGRCPPGLAKKHNGCMPPGQAKKWNIGNRLPRDVIFYDVPPDLVVRIGQPPAGHRFVRVATDILLIAVGTGMVIDAIEDLGKM